MKMKIFFAICCILLLTGCGSTTEMSKPTESSITESNIIQQTNSSTETETSISKSSTTSTESSSSSENKTDYIKEPEITFTTVLNNEGYYEDVWDYIFYDDPSVYGEWECIGTLNAADLDAWIIGNRQLPMRDVGMITNLKLSSDGSAVLTYSSGKTSPANWTRGYVCHNSACPSVSRIINKTFDHEDYLAFEHKSGDYAKNKDVFCYFIFKRLITEEKAEYQIPKADLEESSKTVDAKNNTMTISFTTDVPFESGIQYYLRIYFNDAPFGESDIMYDKPFDTSKRQITIDLNEGNNYICVQFHTDEKEGEISNEIYQSLGDAQTITTTGGTGNSNSSSNVQRNTLTFYTMLAAVNGEAFETMSGYPDYSGVEYYLSQGIQPDYIDVDVYYTCPYCGSENYCTTVQYSYNEGELNLIPDVHCENRNCSHYYEMQGVMLFSKVEVPSTASSSSSSSQPISTPTISLSGSNLIGLTLRDGFKIHGHDPSEYKMFLEDTDIIGYYIIDDTDNDGIMFFTNYTVTPEDFNEEIKGLRISGKNVQISSGFGNIDNTKIGMSKEEMYSILGNDITLRENDDDYVWFIKKNGLTFEFWFDINDNVSFCEIY